MFKHKASLVVGACSVALLAGCSSNTKTTTVASAAPVATVTQTVQATASPSSSAVPAASGASVKAYVEAIGREDDPEAMREGLKQAAPKSVAYVYLEHLANVVEASLDAGTTGEKTDLTPVGNDAFKSCNDPSDDKSCVTFGSFKTDAAGKLVDLTVNKKEIGARLTAGSGEVVNANGVKFTFLTAYKSIQSDALFVTLKVETGSRPVNLNIYSAKYRSPDGKQREASSADGATDVEAKSNTIVSLAFKGVKTGGKVTMDGCIGKDCGSQYNAVIKVG
jgi:hypothetical protein